MLRSIGATKKQIKKNVYFEAFALGVIGIPLGILSGFLASFILIQISNYLLNNMMTEGLKLIFTFSWIATGISILLGVITIWLSSVRSARRASKITPIVAIRNSGNIKIKAKKLKTPKLISKFFGVGGEISYKNLKRNRKKYRTTTISIVVSVAIFIAIYYFSTFVFSEILEENPVNDYNIDVRLFYNDYDEDVNQILNLENINESAVLRSSYTYIPKAKYSKEYLEFAKENGVEDVDESTEITGAIEVYALGEKAYQNYLKQVGVKYEDAKDKGILYNVLETQIYDQENNKMRQKKMDRFGYQAGDKIELTDYAEDGTQTKKESIEIAKTTDILPFGLYRGLPAIIVSDEHLDRLGFGSSSPQVVIDSSR